MAGGGDREHPALTHPQYRADIDGLRAVAVLAVVAFHAFPGLLPGGFVGVDIFFVISGFLISTIIFGNLERGSFRYAEFYARRIRRIFPALIVVLFATLAFGWYALLSDEFRQLGKHLAAGAGFVSNLALWREAGYFDADATAKPLLHLWSLGIEEQFYILWPLLLGLVWRRKHNFLWITLIVALASFAINVWTVGDNVTAAFYSPFSRFWELMIGGILAYARLHKPHFRLANVQVQSALGLLLILASLALINEARAFPGWWALLPTTGAFLAISAGPQAWLNRHVLANRAMVWIGLISYPLYLWHWPLISFAYIIEGREPSRNVRLVLVAASLLLAWLTYDFVELKVRKKPGRMPVFALAALCTVLFGCGLLVLLSGLGPRNNGRDLEHAVQAFNDWEYPPRSFQPFKFNGRTYYSQGGAAGKVLFFGDSHIEQYAPRVSKVLSADPTDNKSAVFAVLGGCPPIPGVGEDQHPDCEASITGALELAHRANIDTVVVGACWNCYFIDMVVHARRPDARRGNPSSYEYYFSQQDSATPVRKYFRTGQGAGPALAALERLLESLKQEHKKVFLLLDNPSGGQYNPRTFFAGTRLTSLTYRNSEKYHRLSEEQDIVRQQLLSVAQRASVTVIDPVAHICTNGNCPTIDKDGTLIYKDSNHFRRSYARDYADFIDIALRR